MWSKPLELHDVLRFSDYTEIVTGNILQLTWLMKKISDRNVHLQSCLDKR